MNPDGMAICRWRIVAAAAPARHPVAAHILVTSNMTETALSVEESSRVEPLRFPAWQVAVAAILAAICAFALPAYSGPDELAHVAYVAALAKGRLPIIPAGELADLATGTTWQGQHPPLFYLVALPFYVAA